MKALVTLVLDWEDMMRENDLSKDMSGPKIPPELRRSWKQRIKLRRNQAELDILHCWGRKAHLLRDKQILSVGVFDEV
ncbi:hypothetical protein Tco_0723827 [Tanacetum coccineum]